MNWQSLSLSFESHKENWKSRSQDANIPERGVESHKENWKFTTGFFSGILSGGNLTKRIERKWICNSLAFFARESHKENWKKVPPRGFNRAGGPWISQRELKGGQLGLEPPSQVARISQRELKVICLLWNYSKYCQNLTKRIESSTRPEMDARRIVTNLTKRIESFCPTVFNSEPARNLTKRIERCVYLKEAKPSILLESHKENWKRIKPRRADPCPPWISQRELKEHSASWRSRTSRGGISQRELKATKRRTHNTFIIWISQRELKAAI